MTANLSDYRARKSAVRAYHPSVRPIWTPADSVDTAQAFAAELANAERGITDIVEPAMFDKVAESDMKWTAKLFGRSRFRRAKVYDGLAVTLLLILAAAFGVILMLLAAPTAKADSDSEAYAYAAHYAGAVCSTLDDYPTVNGMLGIMAAITDDGLTDYQAGQVVGISIAEVCPQYGYLAELFVARYGGRSVA